MKKVLCFAAAALTLFAACQKTTVVYDNSEPQEIAVFAVNKTATKAPVADATFPTDYSMQVAAYLAAGDGVAEGGRNYFNGTTFNGSTTWTGGQYWPVSAATLNFLAVAPQVEATATVAEDETAGATITTVFGATSATPTAEGGDETPEVTNYVSQSVTTVTNNDADQYDVMYAVTRASKVAGSAPSAVGMTFNHAYAWLDFTFKTGNAVDDATIKINSIKVYDVATDGTLTVTVTNPGSDTADMSATPSWSATAVNNGIQVPAPTGDFILSSSITEYNKGLLLVPSLSMSKFVINYTTIFNGVTQNFNYTYNNTTTVTDEGVTSTVRKQTWTAGKKYTYNITMTLSEIEVDPEVNPWDGANGSTTIHANETPADQS